MTEETAYHLLQRRRRELEAQISALKGQIAPKEAELAQIDKMLSVADPPPPSVAPGIPQRSSNASTPSGGYVSALLPFLIDPSELEKQRQVIEEFVKSASPSPEAIAAMQEAIEGFEESYKAALSQLAASAASFDQKFTNMTIKQLLVQALIDHFPKGGKIADIQGFMKVGYGRDIPTASLRPQMHRLKADDVLTQDGEIWNLVPRKRMLYTMYDHPTSRASMKELQDDTPESAARRTIAGGAGSDE